MIDATTRLDILDLLGRAAYALDQHDMALIETCFAPDAVMVLDIAGVEGTPRFEGRDEIIGLMRDSAAEQTDQRRHVTTNTIFEGVSEGVVSVVSNLTLTGVENAQQIRLITSGLYRDRVRREGDAWVLAERRIDLDMPY